MSDDNEFSVERIENINQQTVVAGRVLNGEIRVGDVFLYALKYKSSLEELLESPCSDLHLTVDKLLAYGREIPRATKGLTIGVVFTGESINQLEKGLILKQSL